MEKRLVVTFSDGSRWGVPASVIAKSRAAHYARLDVERDDADYEEVYNTEYEYVLVDDLELLDWASNSMDWEDVAPHAFIVPSEQEVSSKHEEWTNADKVVEIGK